GPPRLAQLGLLMGERRDVGLGVGELRRPEQRIIRAGLHTDPAVHAQREVDREAVEDVAHPLPPAPSRAPHQIRAAGGIRAGTKSAVTALRRGGLWRRTVLAGAVLVPRHRLLVRLDVDA